MKKHTHLSLDERITIAKQSPANLDVIHLLFQKKSGDIGFLKNPVPLGKPSTIAPIGSAATADVSVPDAKITAIAGPAVNVFLSALTTRSKNAPAFPLLPTSATAART